MKIVKYSLLLVLCGFLSATPERKVCKIAFYNVENLFDTINDPHTNDNAYLPTSKLQWTGSRYRKKINALAEVIQSLEASIVGLCEVENAKVLNDLVHADKLKNAGYSYIHADSKDRRGTDVALLYKKSLFTPMTIRSVSIERQFEKVKIRTRDILLVSGILHPDTVHILVNHWPSRRGGGKSELQRVAMAMLTREIVDSLLWTNSKSKLLIMGDFNDEPEDASIREMLLAQEPSVASRQDALLNPFYRTVSENIGSHRYRNTWYMYDQIIFTPNLVANPGGWRYVSKSASVFHPAWLHYKGVYSNGPFRTYLSGKYLGGYSDHFPVMLTFEK